MPGGRKTVKSKNGENLVFSRGGVTSVTPFPCILKTPRWASGSKEAAADEEK